MEITHEYGTIGIALTQNPAVRGFEIRDGERLIPIVIMLDQAGNPCQINILDDDLVAEPDSVTLNTIPMVEPTINGEQFGEQHGYNRRAAYALLESGKVEGAYKEGGDWRIPLTVANAWKKSKRGRPKKATS